MRRVLGVKVRVSVKVRFTRKGRIRISFRIKNNTGTAGPLGSEV